MANAFPKPVNTKKSLENVRRHCCAPPTPTSLPNTSHSFQKTKTGISPYCPRWPGAPLARAAHPSITLLTPVQRPLIVPVQLNLFCIQK